MNKYIYTLTLLLLVLANNMFAQTALNNNHNAIYSATKIDIETNLCAETINKSQIIEKEFSDTKFILDFKKNQLILDSKYQENSKIIEFSLKNTKLIFKNQEEYGKVEAYLTLVNDVPILKFKDHSDDCFFFVVQFTK